MRNDGWRKCTAVDLGFNPLGALHFVLCPGIADGVNYFNYGFHNSLRFRVSGYLSGLRIGSYHYRFSLLPRQMLLEVLPQLLGNKRHKGVQQT